MSKKFLLAVLVCGVSSAVYAGSATYKALDENKDGLVSHEEAEAIPTLADQWTEVDVNEDGKIDAVEFSRFESLTTTGHMHSTPDEAAESADEESGGITEKVKKFMKGE
jgi:EF hand